MAEVYTGERYELANLGRPYSEKDTYLCLVNQPSDSGKLNNPILVFNDTELSFSDLEENLPPFSSMEGYEHYRYFSYPLYIDKSIKMSFVNRLREILINAEYFRVAYAVIPNKERNSRYYPFGVSDGLRPYYFTQRLHSEKPYKDTNLKEFELLSVSYANDSVHVNNIAYAKNDFYSTMKQKIEQHDNYLVVFLVDKEMIFADYIFVLDELRRVVLDIRNAYAIENYSKEYKMLSPEEEEIVYNKIRMRLMEVNKP